MSEDDLNKGLGKPLVVAGLGDVRAQLDRCFLPLGLELDPGFGGRKYEGKINGRTITVTIAMRTRTRYIAGSIRTRKFTGLWMDISVTTPVMSRVMLGQPTGFARKFTQFVQRLRGNKPVPDFYGANENVIAFAYETAWAETFLLDTAVQTHLTTLMANPELPPGAAVFLSPDGSGSPGGSGSSGKWQWTTPALPGDFTPEAAQRWVYSLAHLAAAAEQTPPMTAVQPNWLERQNSTVAAFLVAGLFLFGVPLLLFVCCMLPVLFLFITNTN